MPRDVSGSRMPAWRKTPAVHWECRGISPAERLGGEKPPKVQTEPLCHTPQRQGRRKRAENHADRPERRSM